MLIRMLDSVKAPTIDGRAIAKTSTSPSSGACSTALIAVRLQRRI